MPSDWWDAPTVEACPLSLGPQSARMARRFTRTTFADWGLWTLADDAEVIVGEFVANAVRHGARAEAGTPSSSGAGSTGAGSTGAGSSGAGAFGLRLLRRSGEVMCAVLDPSDVAPVLKEPEQTCEAGRGLQMVDALSDVWGWSPVTGRGKAVWAILFCGS